MKRSKTFRKPSRTAPHSRRGEQARPGQRRPARPARPARPSASGERRRPAGGTKPHPRSRAPQRETRQLIVSDGAIDSSDLARGWDPTGELEREDWGTLAGPLKRAGNDLNRSTALLRQYAAMLLSWNRSFSNLISKNDEKRIVSRHLLESIWPAEWLKSFDFKSWLDFGSGGGLPAIPLLIAGVGERWTLVESRRTKALFLKRVAQQMDLTGIEVIQSRLETLAEDEGRRGRFEAFTSRATLPLAPTLELAAHFVASGGSAFLWKGSSRDEEVQQEGPWHDSWTPDRVMPIGDGATSVSRFIRRAQS